MQSIVPARSHDLSSAASILSALSDIELLLVQGSFGLAN
jgi:hypothetical protein